MARDRERAESSGFMDSGMGVMGGVGAGRGATAGGAGDVGGMAGVGRRGFGESGEWNSILRKFRRWAYASVLTTSA